MIHRSLVVVLAGAVAVAVAALAVSAPSAHAQSRLRAGVLECNGSGGMTFVVGSVHEFQCVYRPDGMPTAEYYRGVVRRVGLDLGFTDRASVAWVVLAPTVRLGPGELAGSYVGAAANASIGVGVGANALVGGSNNTFALQPLSLQGQTGLNVAAGIEGFELYPAR
jgi:Protein of unknown function (DUF992)